MRFMKIALLAVIIFFAMCIGSAHGGPKKIKVYLDAPNEIGHNEGFSLHLMEQMRLADEEDKSYEFVWIKNAIEADYIITVIAAQNPFPVAIKVGNVTNICKQFVVTVLLDRIVDIKFTIDTPNGVVTLSRRGVDPDKTHYMVNQQIDCDLDEIARKVVVEMIKGMSLKPLLAESK